MNIDLYIFNLINGFSGKWPWLDSANIFLAKYLLYILVIALGLFAVLNLKKYWKVVFVSLVAGVVARFIVGTIIRFLWFKERPFVVLHLIPLIDKDPSEASFPSGHMLFLFAISTVIYLYNKKIGWGFYIASAIIGIARIYVRVHWPVDIFMGAIIGIIMGFLTNKVIQRYSRLKE